MPDRTRHGTCHATNLYPLGVPYKGKGKPTAVYDVGVAAPHYVNRPALLARMLFMLALLGGIVAMHTVTLAVEPDSAHAVIATGDQHGAPAHDHTDGTGRSCPGDGCGDLHSTIHACVFIMSVVVFLLGLTVLYRLGIDQARQVLSRVCRHCRRRQRAPPWTVLSLPELSILRI
jgi:hypothetical protein